MRIHRSLHFIRACWSKTQIILNTCMFFKITESEFTVLIAVLYMPDEFNVTDMYNFLAKCETDETFRSKVRIGNILRELERREFITFIAQKYYGFTYKRNPDRIKYFIDAFNSFVTRGQIGLMQREFRPENKKSRVAYHDVNLFMKRLKYAKEKNKKNAVV